jgi:hypothetical protein
LEVLVSRSFRIGLILLGVLSALDLLAPLLTDGEHPPMAVALVASAIGLASLALVVSAWRGATRAVIPLVVLRLLSALAAVPAFFAPGVPGSVMGVAATGIAATILGVVLVLSGERRPVAAGAR